MQLRQLLILVCLLMSAHLAFGQSNTKVFYLGEDEAAYEQFNTTHTKTLLEAADNNLPLALEEWLNMMSALEGYSNRIDYKLDGIKLYLHVFFAPDGKIDRMGFLLRPDSRHVEKAELKALFESFAKSYQLPLQSDKGFAHYTGATFPTYSRRRTN